MWPLTTNTFLGVRSLYVMRLLQYSLDPQGDAAALKRIKRLFKIIHRRQRFGYKVRTHHYFKVNMS